MEVSMMRDALEVWADKASNAPEPEIKQMAQSIKDVLLENDRSRIRDAYWFLANRGILHDDK